MYSKYASFLLLLLITVSYESPVPPSSYQQPSPNYAAPTVQALPVPGATPRQLVVIPIKLRVQPPPPAPRPYAKPQAATPVAPQPYAAGARPPYSSPAPAARPPVVTAPVVTAPVVTAPVVVPPVQLNVPAIPQGQQIFKTGSVPVLEASIPTKPAVAVAEATAVAGAAGSTSTAVAETETVVGPDGTTTTTAVATSETTAPAAVPAVVEPVVPVDPELVLILVPIQHAGATYYVTKKVPLSSLIAAGLRPSVDVNIDSQISLPTLEKGLNIAQTTLDVGEDLLAGNVVGDLAETSAELAGGIAQSLANAVPATISSVGLAANQIAALRKELLLGLHDTISQIVNNQVASAAAAQTEKAPSAFVLVDKAHILTTDGINRNPGAVGGIGLLPPAPQGLTSGLIPQTLSAGIRPQALTSGVLPQTLSAGVLPQTLTSGVIPAAISGVVGQSLTSGAVAQPLTSGVAPASVSAPAQVISTGVTPQQLDAGALAQSISSGIVPLTSTSTGAASAGSVAAGPSSTTTTANTGSSPVATAQLGPGTLSGSAQTASIGASSSALPSGQFVASTSSLSVGNSFGGPNGLPIDIGSTAGAASTAGVGSSAQNSAQANLANALVQQLLSQAGLQNLGGTSAANAAPTQVSLLPNLNPLKGLINLKLAGGSDGGDVDDDDDDDDGDDGDDAEDDYDDDDDDDADDLFREAKRTVAKPTKKPSKKNKAKEEKVKKAKGKNEKNQRRDELGTSTSKSPAPTKRRRKPNTTTTTTSTTEAPEIDFGPIIEAGKSAGKSVVVVDRNNPDNAELMKAIQSVLRGYNQMYNLNWSLDDDLRIHSPSQETSNNLSDTDTHEEDEDDSSGEVYEEELEATE